MIAMGDKKHKTKEGDNFFWGGGYFGGILSLYSRLEENGMRENRVREREKDG